MKTTITIEIENKETIPVLPEEGDTEDKYTKEDLEIFRNDFTNELHDALKKHIQMFVDERIEEEFFDGEFGEEHYIEGMDEFEQYGKLTINIKQIEK